jgi:transposase-like protein
MAKFTAQEKINAVKRYLNGTEGHKTIAKSIGVSHGVFHVWIHQYQYHGESAFEKRYTTYSADDKLEVLTYMNEHGTSLSEAAAVFNIRSPSTIYQWERLFETQGVDALIPRKKGRPMMKRENEKETLKDEQGEVTVEALQAEVERLNMELAYLKKLNALVRNKEKSPNKTKRK